MTDAEIEKFRLDFDSIKYFNSQHKSAKTRISQLSKWDNDGSHTQAINLSIDDKNKLKKALDKALNGKTYEEWLRMSNTLTGLLSRRKKAKETLNNLEQKLLNLNF